MSSDSSTTILLCGVGGQGTILAAHLLAKLALNAGLDVKVSEIHGMSQRGGSVNTVVRFGTKVCSMLADKASCDFVVSFEKLEALRSIDYVGELGRVLVNDVTIKPQSVLAGEATLPSTIDSQLAQVGALVVPADRLAKEAGSIKASNIAMMGALSVFLPFPKESWIDEISASVPPSYKEENISAFELGRSFVTTLIS